MADHDRDDPDRDAILRRRNRLVAIALSGVAAVSVGGCEPCLTPIAPDSGIDASPMPCLEPPLEDAGPRDAGSDAGSDAGTTDPDAGMTAPDGGGASDGGPLPCLAPPP